MAASPTVAKSRSTRRWVRVLTQAVIALVIFGLAAYIVVSGTFVSFELILLALLLLFLGSQIFWLRQIVDLGEHFMPRRVRRFRVSICVGLGYLFVIAYSFPTTIGQGHTFRLGFERTSNIVVDAVFWWWFVGSMAGFIIAVAFGAMDYAGRAALWLSGRVRRHGHAPIATVSGAAPSSGRREFLKQAAVLVSGMPFVAAGYGLLYEREDVEIVRQRVLLAKLPKSFDGFRIAQLADIHMGPFADAAYIRHCVEITNGLRPDLVALTGDFIAWDTAYVREAVRTLGGLRAPHGIVGCLGNHESESNTEEMITSLFAAEGIHILRQQRADVRRGDDVLNLIGTDDVHGETLGQWVGNLYRGLNKELVIPGTVNILLAHEPAPPIFGRAAQLGIDLMLAGHTHGGQLALHAVHRDLNLSRLIYRFNSGWYEQNGTRLYVNRGIGTTGFPIRFGARPEITIFELAAA